MTITNLADAVKAEFSSRLLGGNPVLTQSNIDVMAQYVAFLQFSTDRALENVQSRLTPATATGSTLDDWGATFNVQRLGSTRASGSVTLTGTVGSFAPSGTTLTRCDGIEYVTLEDATLGVDNSVPVEAVLDGSEGNFRSGGVLEMGTVVPGVNSGTISLGIIGGGPVECDDNYRARILATIRNPCRTGTAADYDFWVSQYPGVTRVCVQNMAEGPGTVKVYFMMDNSYPNGIPAAADVAAVQAAVPFPIGVVGTVCAPTPFPVDVRLTGVGTVDASRFAEIRAALENVFLDFFSCDGGEVCIADIYAGLRAEIGNCFRIAEPARDVNAPAGSVPILGSLSVV